jgi:hypothetical protein
MPAVAFHCQAKVISRTKGQSAVACAAYRTRTQLEDERYGKVQDFSRMKGLEFLWHAAPADAPAWAKDVGQTWNEVERAEVRRNSTLAREYVAAFPHQLNAEQREWMLKDFVREEFTRKGLIATAVIHAPDQKGDQRNFHTHVMVAERPVDAEGWSKHKDRSLQSKETLAEVREKWAELGARQLERAGFEVEAERWRHGHKSLKQQEVAALERGDLAYAEQVRDREPTTHVGHVAIAIERKGRVSERGELNREVEARNVERKEIDVDLAAVREQLERLVLEPDAERQEVDSSPGFGEQRRSNERQADTAVAGAETSERAQQGEESRAIWKEQRQLDRQIDRVEAAQERPQSAAVQAICRAYAESSTGAELVEELKERGFMVCRVSAEEAERSQRQRAVLGTTPSYQEGEVLAVTERGHAYRINAETIAMTATNTYDHVQNVSERLASIEPQDVLSLSQAQEVVTQKANERGSIPIDRFEQVPSAWEIGRGAEAAVDAAEGVASKGAEVVIALGEGVANFLEGSLFGGASRKAPGGAEYVPPAAAGPPPPLPVVKPPWLEKQEKLRTTSGVEATEDPAARGKVEEKQGQSFAEQFEELRRRNAKAARERAELYRDRDDDGDRDRER